jgi:hypothetical protein
MKAKTHFFYFLLFIFLFQTILVSVAVGATRIMPLGDSITQGIDSGEPDENRQVSYRKALWDKLVADGYDVDFVGSLNSGSTIFGDLDPADHEGHPGWRDDEIVNGRVTDPDAGKLADWLADHQPDIVLLHIGTNVLDPSPDDVDDILDEIDNYSLETWVILARIINRRDHVCPNDSDTTIFNDNVEAMAQDRINTLGDKIKIVDMECGAEIDYREQPDGDMDDIVHPYQDPATGEAPGYAKMGNEWYSALQEILPDPEPDPEPDPPNNSSDSGCFIGTITE